MKFQLKILTIIIYLILTTSISSVTIDQFLGFLESTHIYVKKEKFNAQLSKQSIRESTSKYDVNFSLTPTYYTKENLATNAFSPTKLTNLDLNTSLSKKIWFTGGELSLSGQFGRANQTLTPVQFGENTLNLGYDTYYQHRVGVSYTQPLLRNLFGTLDHTQYDIQQILHAQGELNTKESLETFYIGMIHQFLDYLKLEKMLRLNKRRFDYAQQQFNDSKRQFNDKLIQKKDYLMSIERLRFSEQSLILSESQLNGKRREILNNIGIYNIDNDTILNATVEFPLYDLPDLSSYLSDLSKKIHSNRTIQILEKTKSVLQRQRISACEKLKPDMNLMVGYGRTSGAEELNNSRSFNKPDTTVSVGMRYPLGVTKHGSEVDKIDIQLKQIDFEIKYLSDNLSGQANNLLTQLDGLYKIIKLNFRQIDSSKEVIEEENKLYTQGRSPMAALLQAKDNEMNLRKQLIQNAIQYYKLYYQFLGLVDDLDQHVEVSI